MYVNYMYVRIGVYYIYMPDYISNIRLQSPNIPERPFELYAEYLE
jgi:hypothetical protein